MSDIAKKNLLSQLWDQFTDPVDALRADLAANHAYLSSDEQAENLRIDIAGEVARAGWTVSPNVIEALCKGGAALMTLDPAIVTIDLAVEEPPTPAEEAQGGDFDSDVKEAAPPAEAPPPVHPDVVEANTPASTYQRLVTPVAIRNRAGA